MTRRDYAKYQTGDPSHWQHVDADYRFRRPFTADQIVLVVIAAALVCFPALMYLVTLLP